MSTSAIPFEVTTAKIATWTSLALGYGIAIGCLYLKRYWSIFGLDPFQFADVSDLALVGFAGFGATLTILVLAMSIGAVAGDALTRTRHKWLVIPIFGAILLFVAYVTAFVVHGLYLGAGFLVMAFATFCVVRTPLVPIRVRKLPELTMAIGLLIYVPFATMFYAAREATIVIRYDRGWELSPTEVRTRKVAGARPGYAGKLGEYFVFYDSAIRSTTLLHGERDSILTIKKSTKSTQK